MPSPAPRLLPFLLLLAFSLKITLTLFNYGTNDALTWEADAAKLRT